MRGLSVGAAAATLDGGQRFLHAALVIAGELAAAGPDWTGDDLIGESPATARVVRRACGDGLYAGGVGIGAFLVQAAQVGTDPALARCGNQALDGALARALGSAPGASQPAAQPPPNPPRPQPRDLSLYNGDAGIALAAHEAGRRCGDPALVARGTALAQRVVVDLERLGPGAEHDLIGGVAGTLIALLAISAHEPEAAPRWAPTLCRLADALCDRARPHALGLYWPDPTAAAGAPGLCGMAHGASGVGWALDEAAWVIGHCSAADSGRWRHVAAAARLYERSWFDPATSHWPDLRELPATPGAVPPPICAWCHGGVGIGAARWRRYSQYGQLPDLAEASACQQGARKAVAQAQLTLGSGAALDTSLCHGLAGLAELFLLAFEATGVPEHLLAARRVGELMLASHQQRGSWGPGLAGTTDVPGLMVGRAGTGTTLLRLHDVRSAPSPLLPGYGVGVPGAPKPKLNRSASA